MNCPKCNKSMILRNGKYGQFWGCSGFPKCRSIVKYKHSRDAVKKVKEIKTFEDFKPSNLQLAIKDHFLNMVVKSGTQSVFINATAGSGKTTTLLWLLSFLEKNSYNVLLSAFNKKIAEEIESKVEDWINVKTLHALGMGILRDCVGKVNVNNYKSVNILQRLLGYDYTQSSKKEKEANYDKETYYLLKGALKKLVGIYKNTQIVKSTDQKDLDKTLEDLILLYGINVKSEMFSLLLQYTKEVLRVSEDITPQLNSYGGYKPLEIDFDDMVYLVVIHDLHIDIKFDIVLVDESQDLNPLQFELLKSVIDGNSKIIFVGDRNQSIYAFRGAMLDSVDHIIEEFGCTQLKLNVTYRNSKAVTYFVNDNFPDIEHICLDDAPEGEVSSLDYESEFLQLISDKSMVLSRINSAMVAPVFKLLKAGKKATILGKEIGTNLINIISKMQAKDINDLYDELNVHREEVMGKLLEKGFEEEAENFSDIIETIFRIAEECRTVDKLIKKIDTLFSDNADEGIVFCTIHKAKGLENNNVYILRPDLLPHPKGDEDQECNLMFVAYTRAIFNLYFITGM